MAQHARATVVHVDVDVLADTIRLSIRDNGKSFRVDRVTQDDRFARLGLIGMRERTEMVGGNFSIESAPGKGTTVSAGVPLGAARGRRIRRPSS